MKSSLIITGPPARWKYFLSLKGIMPSLYLSLETFCIFCPIFSLGFKLSSQYWNIHNQIQVVFHFLFPQSAKLKKHLWMINLSCTILSVYKGRFPMQVSPFPTTSLSCFLAGLCSLSNPASFPISHLAFKHAQNSPDLFPSHLSIHSLLASVLNPPPKLLTSESPIPFFP